MRGGGTVRDRVRVVNERVGRRSTVMSRGTRLPATVVVLIVASIFGSVGLLSGSVGAAPPSNAQLLGAAKSTSPWKVQKTPKLKDSLGSALSDVSCISATSCVAVGDDENSDGGHFTLAEVWNGATWKIQKTPNPAGFTYSTLTGVSCTSTASTTACMAVGDYENASGEFTLAELWNGAAWKIQKTPTPTGSTGSTLNSVSCTVASSCTAVGDYNGSFQFVLAEVWNGATWKIQKTPTPTVSGESGGVLSSVSCGSVSACAAVGYSGVLNQSFSEVRDGSTWTIQPIPNPEELGASDLYGVSCTSSISCTAVGTFLDTSFVYTTLAEVWDGTAWTVQVTPNPTGRESNQLLGVSCVPGACTGIGYSGLTLAEVWNGSTWRLQKIPNPKNQIDNKLTGVSCTSATVCTAVGSSSGGALVEAK
jgi:hypothetical protein